MSFRLGRLFLLSQHNCARIPPTFSSSSSSPLNPSHLASQKRPRSKGRRYATHGHTKNLWPTADLRLPLIRTRFSFTFILFLSSTLGCIIQQQLANLTTTTTTTAGAAAGRPADPFPNSFFWIDLNDNHKRDSLAPNNKQRQFHFQENKENQEETTTKCTTMSNFPPLFECVGG